MAAAAWLMAAGAAGARRALLAPTAVKTAGALVACAFSRAVTAPRLRSRDLAKEAGMDLNRQSLLEFLNREAMTKGDMKERAELLSRHNPQCLAAGSVVQVEVMVNQTTRQRVSYTGTLIAVRRKGMGSNIVILFEVMGMLTTMTFPVFSPMVTAINVVRRTQARRSKLYYLERQTDLRYPVSESALQDVIQADFYARNPNAGENARVPRIQQGMSGLQAANKITAASVEEAAAKARRQ